MSMRPNSARPPSARFGSRNVAAAKDKIEAGNRVQVSVRIRPFNQSDMNDDTVAVCRDQNDYNSVFVEDGKRGRTFSYDNVFTAGQQEVYHAIGKPMLKEVFDGFNVCLFAYGQTGSGKTYSIQGDAAQSDTEGIVPRFVREMFDAAQAKMEEDPDLTIKITMSFVEVYMEKVRDLLSVRSKQIEPESLELHEDVAKKVFVKDLGVHAVLGSDRVEKLLARGNTNRQQAETKMNEFSSRSHSIVIFTITQTFESLERRDLESVAWLVDLAGSERQSKAEATGLQFEEAKKINQSLLMLGRALNSFSEGRNDFLSLRESKLTRLLSECFGGNSKTWMLATVSPSSFNLSESLSTLEYATNAKNITNRAQINKMARHLEIKQLRELVTKLEGIIETNNTKLAEVFAENAKLEAENNALAGKVQAAEDRSKQEAEYRELLLEHDKLREQMENMRKQKMRTKHLSRILEEPPRPHELDLCYRGTATISLSNLFSKKFEIMTLLLKADDGDKTKSATTKAGEIVLPPMLVIYVGLMAQPEDGSLVGVPLDWSGKELVYLQLRIIAVQNLPQAVQRGTDVSYFFVQQQEDEMAVTPLETNDPRNARFEFRQRFLMGPKTSSLMDYFATEDVLSFVVRGFR